jgi:hypothetical protein
LERLELIAGKLARSVLRGGSGGNVTSLPYKFFRSFDEVDHLGV